MHADWAVNLDLLLTLHLALSHTRQNYITPKLVQHLVCRIVLEVASLFAELP